MTDEEKRLAQFIEQTAGAKVVSVKRQVRWRPAWFVEAERDGKPVSLYVRGDKHLDAEIYPGLDREAGIIQLFEKGGLPVAHVYGMCPDPKAIVMSGIPGVREVEHAADDAERRQIAFEYVEFMAQMHRLDIAPFVDMGVQLPATPEALATSYFDENVLHYRRVKAKPEPMLEFAIRWVRANTPKNRTRPAVIHGDPGQFHFQDGHLTGVYDFEATHIGDPLMDLACLRMRHPFESLGADPMDMIRHYAEITGEPIDVPALKWHTAAFAVTPGLSMAGILANPEAATMQAEYLFWDIITRRALVWAMAECLGVTLEPITAPDRPDRKHVVNQVLRQTLERLVLPGGETEAQGEAQRHSALMLTAWLGELTAKGPWVEEQNLDEVAQILGRRPADWVEADAALEQFVLSADPSYDRQLLTFFGRQVERDLAVMGPFGARAAGYALPPVTL
jgi:aminoglycoside phosphotransferase (APT) family kinase protein